MESKDIVIIIAIVLFTFGAGILSAYQYYDGAKKDKQNDVLNNALQVSQTKIIEEQQKNNQKADALADANKINFELSQQLNSKASNILEANEEIKNAQQVAINQLLETDKKSQELVDVYKKLDLANEGIKKVQEETINMLTGGPSFGYFVAGDITEATSGSFSLEFINDGNYHLYDVTANIIDYMVLYNPEVAKLPYTEENMKLWRILVDVQNKNPHAISSYGKYSFNNTNRLEFISEIWARNGHFQQRLKLYFKNGKWLRATKVIKWIIQSNQESPVLLEEFDKGFPTLPNGKVDWENYNPYLPLE